MRVVASPGSGFSLDIGNIHRKREKHMNGKKSLFRGLNLFCHCVVSNNLHTLAQRYEHVFLFCAKCGHLKKPLKLLLIKCALMFKCIHTSQKHVMSCNSGF